MLSEISAFFEPLSHATCKMFLSEMSGLRGCGARQRSTVAWCACGDAVW